MARRHNHQEAHKQLLLGCLLVCIFAGQTDVISAHHPHDTIEALAVRADCSELIVKARGIVYRSSDHGNTWIPTYGASTFTDGGDASIAYRDSDAFLLQGDQKHKLSRFTDGSWVRVNELNSNIGNRVPRSAIISGMNASRQGSRLVFVNASMVLAIDAAQQLLQSTNGGRTFESFGLRDQVCAVKIIADAIWVGLQAGGVAYVYLSDIEHGRQSWKRLSLLPSSSPSTSLAGAAVRPCARGGESILVGCADGTLWQLCDAKSDNDAIAWLVMRAPLMIADEIALQLPLVEKMLQRIDLRQNMRVFVEVLSNGDVLYASGHFVEVFSQQRREWSAISFNQGLLPVFDVVKLGIAQTTHLVSCTVGEASVDWLGTFSGVFRSVDSGAHWTKLDATTSIITSLASASLKNHVLLGLCSYGAGCRELSIEGDNLERARISDVFPDSLPFKQCMRYGLLQYSPNYATSGIKIMACSGRAYRLADFKHNFDQIMFPGANFGKVVHSIVFSPDFNRDSTVFLAGWGIGVIKSEDGGRTFSECWDGNGPSGIDARYDLVISPRYATDKRLAISYRGENMPGRDRLILPAGCTVEDAKHYYNETCHVYGGYNLKSSVALSTDGGKSWRHISDYGDWSVVGFVGRDDSSEEAQLFATQCGVLHRYDEGQQRWLPEAGGMTAGEGEQTAMTQQDLLPTHQKEGSGDSHAAVTHQDVLLAGLQHGGGVVVLRGNETHQWPSEHAQFGQTMLPGSSYLRGIGRLMAVAPGTQLVLFSTWNNVVRASDDNGKTWHDIYYLEQSSSQCESLNNCKRCRSTKHKEVGALNKTMSWRGDIHALCLDCRPGFSLVIPHRPRNGTFPAVACKKAPFT